MSATTFNYHFVLPPDLHCQSQQLPIFPKRTNEETEITVTIKKSKDWPFIIVILLGIITFCTATYAFSSYLSKSKSTKTPTTQVKPSVSRTSLQPRVNESAPTNLEVLKIESLPSTNVKSISAAMTSKNEDKPNVSSSNDMKSDNTVIVPVVPKVTKPEISKSITSNRHPSGNDKLSISPSSLKEIERSPMPITSPKFIVETEPSKVQKGGIFKRPTRAESAEENKAVKPLQKPDTTPQTLF